MMVMGWFVRGWLKMAAKEVQEKITELLKNIFNEVNKEWNAAKNSQDDYNRKIYCPRLDIAIGPFNINRNFQDREKILQSIKSKKKIIDKICKEGHLLEFPLKNNNNPRCAIAIEIEYSGSRKHMLGDITNASILGGIGIIVAVGNKKLKQFVKMKGYIDFAVKNEKIKPIFNNIVIIGSEDLIKILEKK